MRRATPDILGAVLSADAGDDRMEIRRQLKWDYSQVAPVDRKAVEDAAVDVAMHGRRMTASAMAVGASLLRAKGLLMHGQFEDWCTVEFGMSQRTAQNMMNVAKEFDGKSEIISLLSDTALYLLAAPSTPEPVRTQVLAEAQTSPGKVSVKRVKQMIADAKPVVALPPISLPSPAQYGTVTVEVEGDLPLPEWLAAPHVDMRVSKASRLINIYQQAIGVADEYGELTGCHSETLAPARELTKMIGRLQRLIDVLEGRMVEPMEDCD